MGAGDIWQVILEATYLGQQMRNVFYYFQNTSNVDDLVTANELLLAFEEEFFTDNPGTGLTGGLFTTGTAWTGLQSLNLFEPAPFSSIAFSTPYNGTNSTLFAASFLSIGFTSARKRRDIRSGRKRFGGIGESVSDANGIVASALLSADVIEASLSADLSYSGNAFQTFTPVVVGRIKEVDPVDGSVTYRLPTNANEAIWYVADNWVVDPLVTTQNSRKAGRGV